MRRLFAAAVIVLVFSGCGDDGAAPAQSTTEAPTTTETRELTEQERTELLAKITSLAHRSGATLLPGADDRDACRELGEIAERYRDVDSIVSATAESWWRKC